MNGANGKIFDCLPILAFFGYWLYACLGCAISTGEPRMLWLGVVNVPLLAVMAAAALKLARPGERR